jgi:hypothetical protein
VPPLYPRRDKSFQQAYEAHGPFINLDFLGVNPAAAGQGLGRVLLAQCLREADEQVRLCRPAMPPRVAGKPVQRDVERDRRGHSPSPTTAHAQVKACAP